MHPPCSCSAYLLERYATKIMQCNTKCWNRKYSPTWYKNSQTNMLPESCRSRYQILGSPTNEHIICGDSCLPNHVQKPDPQYQNYINTVVPQQDHTFSTKGSKSCFNLSCSSSRLLTCCSLWQLTDCPVQSVRWGHYNCSQATCYEGYPMSLCHLHCADIRKVFL